MQLSSRVIVITNQSFLIIKKGMYLERQINKSLCQTSIKESANSRKVSMLLNNLSKLFVRFTLKCISNIPSSSHQ